MGDNPLAKALGLSPHTGGQTWYNYIHVLAIYSILHISRIHDKKKLSSFWKSHSLKNLVQTIPWDVMLMKKLLVNLSLKEKKRRVCNRK